VNAEKPSAEPLEETPASGTGLVTMVTMSRTPSPSTSRMAGC
jgi:hypothetical protein